MQIAYLRRAQHERIRERGDTLANDYRPTTNDYFPEFSGRACTLLCFWP